MKSLFVLTLVFGFAVKVNAVALNGVCTTNSDCSGTTDNSYCKKETTNCGKGYCKCKDAYTEDSSSCKPLKKYDQVCASTDVCEVGTACTTEGSSDKCTCTVGTTYNTLLATCIPDGKKAVGETCSVLSDCYNTLASSAIECVGTPLKCQCKTGYKQESYQCRKPHYGEVCTTAVGCGEMMSAGQTEDCTSDKCVCPSGSSLVTSTYSETTYKLCYTTVTDKKAKGESCTNNHECSSYFCSQCPGESGNTCNIFAGSNAVKTSSVGIMTLLSVAIMFM